MINEYKQMVVFLVILRLFNQTKDIAIRRPVIWPGNR
jgi:hypothetical protein